MYNNQVANNYMNYPYSAAMFSYDVNITAEQEELLADLIATYGSEITYITNEIFRKLKWESYWLPFFYAYLNSNSSIIIVTGFSFLAVTGIVLFV